MTDLVSQYIKKGLHSLYYAFYVIIEGIFKVSHSWNPIISIAGIISLLVALPLISIIRLQVVKLFKICTYSHSVNKYILQSVIFVIILKIILLFLFFIFLYL